MRRRQFLAALATGVAGALAGCSDPYARLDLAAVDDAGIAERYARGPDQMRDEHRRIVVDAVEGDNATQVTHRDPFEPDRPVAHEGSYYDLQAEAVGEREATGYDLEVDYDPEDATPDLGAVAYEDLPEIDRAALGDVVPPPGDEPPTGEGYDMGRRAVYTDEEAERSVLVPEPEYDVVTHDGERYRLRVGEGESVTVTEYRYTAEQVAADDAALAEQVRERYLFGLADLTDAQRRILDSAAEDGYREGEPTRAFRSLVDRLRGHDPVEADEYGDGGEWLARYDGQLYWVRLSVPETYQEETVARETPSEY